MRFNKLVMCFVLFLPLAAFCSNEHTFSICNVNKISLKAVQFDVWMKNTSAVPTDTLYVQSPTFNINFNKEVKNGGKLTVSMLTTGLPVSKILPLSCRTNLPVYDSVTYSRIGVYVFRANGKSKSANLVSDPTGFLMNHYALLPGDSVLCGRYQISTSATALASQPFNFVFRPFGGTAPMTSCSYFMRFDEGGTGPLCTDDGLGNPIQPIGFTLSTSLNESYLNNQGYFDPIILLNAPKGGEIWLCGNTKIISWFSSLVDTVRLQFSADSGRVWNTIEEKVPASGGNYSWTIPDITSNSCKVRIVSIADSSVSAASPNVFTIAKIALLTPKGGEKWLVGDVQSIKWLGRDLDTVKIEYSTNFGSSWTLILGATPASADSLLWSIPNTPSTNCLVKISSIVDSTATAISVNIFTIYRSISLVAPNGGEKWIPGSSNFIQWNSWGVDTVQILYSIDGGINWITLVTRIPSAVGVYSWTVPPTESANCKVKISSVSDTSVNAISSKAFAITLSALSTNNHTFSICNTNRISANHLQFDIWMKNTSAAITDTLYIESPTFNINFNKNIHNGGKITVSLVTTGLPVSKILPPACRTGIPTCDTLKFSSNGIYVLQAAGSAKSVNTALDTSGFTMNYYSLLPGDSVLCGRYQIATSSESFAAQYLNLAFRPFSGTTPVTSCAYFKRFDEGGTGPYCTADGAGKPVQPTLSVLSTAANESYININDIGNKALPVELSTFSCSTSGRDAVLLWTTAGEINTSGFVVERKKSGCPDWIVVGSLPAAGSSTNIKRYCLTDIGLNSGKYQYRLKMVDNDGTFVYSEKIVDCQVGTPKKFELSQNYPNPFNPTTKISYQLPEAGHVRMEIFNLTGRSIGIVEDGLREAGYYVVEIQSSLTATIASGVYVYRMTVTGKTPESKFTAIKKMILLK